VSKSQQLPVAQVALALNLQVCGSQQLLLQFSVNPQSKEIDEEND